jgi:hypothetical protein
MDLFLFDQKQNMISILLIHSVFFILVAFAAYDSEKVFPDSPVTAHICRPLNLVLYIPPRVKTEEIRPRLGR